MAVVLLGAYAVAATGSALDRASQRYPAVARLAFAPFESFALAARSDAALKANRPAEAARLARRLVAREPVSPEASALLGTAALLRGDNRGADAAFRVAGTMGWRVPLTQLYWFERAARGGDMTVAAIRLDALLREDPVQIARYAPALQIMEARADGRAALAERLALDPPWLPFWAQLADSQPAPVLRNRAALALQVANGGRRVGCEGARALTIALVAARDGALAQQVWSAHCRPATALAFPVDTPDLLASGPFDWTVVPDPETFATFARASPAGGRLTMRSESSFAREIVRRFVVLAPGRYRLDLVASAGAAGGIVVTAGCTAESASRAALSPVAGKLGATFVVAPDCGGTWLSLGLAPGTGEIAVEIAGLRRLAG